MYEIYEADRLVLLTDSITEVCQHIASEGFEFCLDVLGTKVFTNPDGRTAAVSVRETNNDPKGVRA